MPGEVKLAIWHSPAAGGEPIVCLHGITAQHRAFNALARELSGLRQLVGVDLRGRGDSEKPSSGYGLEAHARDLLRVLDHLGLRSAVVAGHSMGAFVAVKAALLFPERVRALMLLDGGWPRVETAPEKMTGEQREELAALSEGLERAFRRLEMTFESPEAYLEFWFPGQGLAPSDLPPDLADYYLYDLEEVEGGYRPKCSSAAAREDSPSVSSESPTAEEMREVGCPVALVRAAEGFFPGSRPLIPDEARDAMAGALDVREEALVEGATHYTMLWPEHVGRWARICRDLSWAERAG